MNFEFADIPIKHVGQDDFVIRVPADVGSKAELLAGFAEAHEQSAGTIAMAEARHRKIAIPQIQSTGVRRCPWRLEC